MKTIYLCGPIFGIPKEQSIKWRQEAIQYLLPCGYKILDPTSNDSRCWPSRQNVQRDRLFVKRSDLIYVNFEFFSNTNWPIGSLIEIGWADMDRKPIVINDPLNVISYHPFIQDISPFIYKTQFEALHKISQLLQ